MRGCRSRGRNPVLARSPRLDTSGVVCLHSNVYLPVLASRRKHSRPCRDKTYLELTSDLAINAATTMSVLHVAVAVPLVVRLIAELSDPDPGTPGESNKFD